ncbi:hypothetical protein AN958_04765 [Leucoagaricus sp. SymC.cos]|nr:hypothetical protein AN958_04765 [Leucoagaricus sp. SymC.cos]
MLFNVRLWQYSNQPLPPFTRSLCSMMAGFINSSLLDVSQSQSSTPTPAPPGFGLTWGVQFVAYSVDIINGELFLLVRNRLCLTTQWQALVFQYFRSQAKHDGLFVKLVVATMGILATNHVLFVAMMNYADYVTLFGNYDGQNRILYQANVMLLSTYLLAFVSQQWAHITKRNIYYVAPVVLISLVQICEQQSVISTKSATYRNPYSTASGIAQTVLVAKVGLYSKLQFVTGPVACTSSGAACACDILITVLLCYVLHDSRSGIRRSDSVVDKMIMYAINRGAMTSIFALLQLITFLALETTFVFMLFILPSSQLYVISVCSMLLTRDSLRAKLKGPSGFTGSTSFPLDNFSEPRPGRVTAGSVTVATSVIKWNDKGSEPYQANGAVVSGKHDVRDSESV